MPLKRGTSRQATEMAAGKPQKQAVAIAYSEKRQSGGILGNFKGKKRGK